VPKSCTIINITGDSTPTPQAAIKRTSSDASVSFGPSPPSSKRLKKDAAAEKENIFQLGGCDKGKGKAIPPDRKFGHPDNNDDDESWKKMPLDEERNPWAKLDRDFPHPALPTPLPTLPSESSAIYPDLLSVRD
jgi:hypothetical protein